MEVLLNDEVNESLTQARVKMKADYDKGKKDTDCQPGSWVFLKDQNRKSSLSPCFQGPYIVLSRKGPNVKLRFRNGRARVVHLNRCKNCPRPSVEIQVEGNNLASQSEMEDANLTESDTISGNETDTEDPVGTDPSDIGSNPGTHLRRSTRERQPPTWLQEELWPDNFSDDSISSTY